MLKYLVVFVLCFFYLRGFTQSRDYSQWIDFAHKHASGWLQIAPGLMGPNALPVPQMDYALIGEKSEIELGVHYHQMDGDTAINSYIGWYWNIVPQRVAVKIWGQPSETFHSTNKIRDKRQVYYDDKGWTTQTGDLLVSTYIQIIKNKKNIPDLSINYTLKTTTGENYHARYTNAGMNYFYLAAGKSFTFSSKILDKLRIAAMGGFYVWQVNKAEMAQDEGPLFMGGISMHKGTISLYNEMGGYRAYDAYKHLNNIYGQGTILGHNDPLIYRLRIEKTGKAFDLTAEYQTGFRDYHYTTFKLGVIYKFNTPSF